MSRAPTIHCGSSWPVSSVIIVSKARLEHMRGDPRVALDVLDESDWHTHVSVTGHVEQMREGTDLAGIDRLARKYTGQPYPQRDRPRISAWIALDGWRALKDSSQPG